MAKLHKKAEINKFIALKPFFLPKNFVSSKKSTTFALA